MNIAKLQFSRNRFLSPFSSAPYHFPPLYLLVPPVILKVEGGSAVATVAQILANRANARRSTGPRTPQGKARSSQNNRRYGFRSAHPEVPSAADHPELAQLLHDLRLDILPQNPAEENLCLDFATAVFELRLSPKPKSKPSAPTQTTPSPWCANRLPSPATVPALNDTDEPNLSSSPLVPVASALPPTENDTSEPNSSPSPSADQNDTDEPNFPPRLDRNPIYPISYNRL